MNMRANTGLGEDTTMTEEPNDLAEVQRRLQEIQRRKRGRVRWGMSKDTAELAIVALEEHGPEPPRSSTGKPRRRKRHKRLL
jgi:hypothetical protein